MCGFEAELPDKLLLGEVKERQEARHEYQAAVARGETAALLEQDKAGLLSLLCALCGKRAEIGRKGLCKLVVFA